LTTHEILHVIAEVMGVTALGLEETLEDTLLRDLGERPATLLIWDNLEQVVQPARDLGTAWLQRLPELSVLATSRHRLHMHGEAVQELAPLSTSDGVTLLVARAAQLGVDVDRETPEARALVEALEGIPLAIELAAARLNLLDLGQVLDRLSLDLLRSSRGGRHGTLRLALGWSWSLLTEAEQQALAHITVFPGTFDVSGIEAILQVDGALDMLQDLRDRSWICATGGKLHLFDTIRRFAAEHLDEAVRPVIERRHAEYVLGQVDASPAYLSPGTRFSNKLREDLAAIIDRYTLADPDLAARAMVADHEARWRLRSAADSRNQLERALSLTQAVEIVSRAHTYLANLQDRDPLKALDAAWACLAELPPSNLQLSVLRSRARFESRAEDFKASLATVDLAARIQASINDPIWVGTFAIERARILAQFGEKANAIAALAPLCQHANADISVAALYTKGHIHLQHGEARAAERDFEKVLSIAPERRPVLVGLLGIVAVEQGDTVRGRALLAEGHAHSKKLGDERYFAEDLIELSLIDHLEGHLSEAIAGYRRASSMMSNLSMAYKRILVLALLVIASHQSGLEDDVALGLEELDKWSSSLLHPMSRRMYQATRAVITNDIEALTQLSQLASSGAICSFDLRRILQFGISQ
jgi:tetratricopeptide (TPR) repeat protein